MMPACQECGEAVKRKSRKFCSHKCKGAARGRQLRKPEMWRKPNALGYIDGTVWQPDGTQKCVRQHRWVMERHLGRELLPSEDIHHINGVKHDNRIENLQIMGHGAHSSMHGRMRAGRRLNLSEKAKELKRAQCKKMLERKRELGLIK